MSQEENERNYVKNFKRTNLRPTLIEMLLEIEEDEPSAKSADCDSKDSYFKSDHASNSKCSNDPAPENLKHCSKSEKRNVQQRKHKRKPYHKKTEDERRKLEERISKNIHEQTTAASCVTLSPNNTTLLMEDHDIGELEYEIQYESEVKEDLNISDDNNSSHEDENQKYDSIPDDIKNMAESEVLREIIQIEDEIESIEHALELDAEAGIERNQMFHNHIEKLKQENSFLVKSNIFLRKKIARFMPES